MDNHAVTLSTEEYTLLNEKLERVSELLEAQERRQRELVDLKDDMMPIVNHAIKLTIDELAEVGMDFQLEDLLFIMKRVLRNTKLIMRLMDQLEAVSAIGDEVQLLGPQMMSSVVELLDDLEHKGVFSMAKGGFYVLEQLAANTSEEELKSIGDQIGPLMKKAGGAIEALSESDVKAPSLLSLLGQMNDPEIRLVLSRMLAAAKALA